MERERKEGGWHEVVSVFWGMWMSMWGYLIEHQACVHKGCVCVEEGKLHNRGKKRGRRWMESRVDVMLPLAAIT